MHSDTDTTKGSVVFDRDRALVLVDRDGDRGYTLGVEGVAVDRIDEDFIKDFQESWGILEILLGECITLDNPVVFRAKFNWTDIGIRSLENVLDVGELLDAHRLDILITIQNSNLGFHSSSPLSFSQLSFSQRNSDKQSTSSSTSRSTSPSFVK